MDQDEVKKLVASYEEAVDFAKKIDIGRQLCRYYLYNEYDFEKCRKYGLDSLKHSKQIGDKESSVRLLWIVGVRGLSNKG